MRGQCTGGGGGYDPFLMYHRKKLLRGEAQKGLMPDFLCVLGKKLGVGGVIPKFLVCTQRILLRVSECGGGGIMPEFFMCTRKGGLYPNFWCIIKEYYCEWGGAYARFFMRTRKLLGRGGLYPNFGVYSKNITAGGGGGLCQIFLCVREKN